MSSRFFQNLTCEYFPCHRITEEQRESFNCLFCYCPLYNQEDCGGTYVLLANGWKDCSSCTLPHFDYDAVVGTLIRTHNRYPSQENPMQQ